MLQALMKKKKKKLGMRSSKKTMLKNRVLINEDGGVMLWPTMATTKIFLAAPGHPLAVSVGWGFLRGVGDRKRPTAWTNSLRNLCHRKKTPTRITIPLLIPTWYTIFYINYIKLSSSACFKHHPLIFRRSVMLIVHICSLWYSHSLQVAVLCTC